jgi:glycosyltransferase involved in cell wall biosynthesis
MNDSQLELSIVIPCLNEEDTVGLCIDKAFSNLKKLKITGEVILSDNGSSDNSVSIAQTKGAKIVNVKNKGYGAALKAGIEKSKGKYILFADADNSYDFNQIDKFYEELKKGNDLVQGCRLESGGGKIEKGAMPFSHRYFGTPLLSFVARLFYKLPFKDIFCGMRAFKRETYLKSTHISDGMVFAIENLIKLKNFGNNVKEVPINFYKDGRVNTKNHLSTINDGLRSLKLLLIFCPKYIYFIPSTILFFFSLFFISETNLNLQPDEEGTYNYFKFILTFFLSYQLFMFGLFSSYLSNELGFVDQKINKNPLKYFKLQISLFLSFVLLIIGFLIYFYQITFLTINSNLISIFFIFFSIINIFNSLLVSLVELIAKK